ncbi:MAG: hypothetical protein IKQ97_07830 [Eubacterium sp.]|nr:hypothetical protein [Eubacterium sp.]
MSVFLIVMLVIIGVLAIGCVVLYFVGKRLQKKQEESQVQMEAQSQVATILVIDKAKMRLKDAGLPAVVLENTPKYLRRSKVPVVKAKIGPKIMTLMCDDKIFPQLPVKKNLKVKISGIYIMGVIGRGALEAPQEKVGRLKRLRQKISLNK